METSSMTRIAFLAVLALLLACGTSQGAPFGDAWVASVDHPENCLRIRSGPGSNYAVVGCLRKGAVLQLTGNRTSTNWAEIAKPVKGWAWGPQVSQNKVVRGSTGPGVTYVETPANRPYYRSYRYPQSSGFYYGGPGARVRVGPGGGVAVGVGGVGVRVGPGGGVGVRVR